MSRGDRLNEFNERLREREHDDRDRDIEREVKKLSQDPRGTALALLSARVTLRISASRLRELGDEVTAMIAENELEKE